MVLLFNIRIQFFEVIKYYLIIFCDFMVFGCVCLYVCMYYILFFMYEVYNIFFLVNQGMVYVKDLEKKYVMIKRKSFFLRFKIIDNFLDYLYYIF